MKLRKGQLKKSIKKLKFGLKVSPIARTNIALNIDKRNGNSKWRDSMNLKIDNLWK